MNYRTDPALYDHVFYPSLCKPLFLLTLFLGVPAVSFLLPYYLDGMSSGWLWLGISFALVFLIGIFFTLNFSRKLAIGINQEGVYTWHLGFIPWKEIRDCQTERTISSPTPVSISIALRDTDSFLKKNRLGKTKRFLFLLRGRKIKIPAHLVAARLPQLIKLLKSYHREARNKELTWPMDML